MTLGNFRWDQTPKPKGKFSLMEKDDEPATIARLKRPSFAENSAVGLYCFLMPPGPEGSAGKLYTFTREDNFLSIPGTLPLPGLDFWGKKTTLMNLNPRCREGLMGF
ncbi:MAG: hypothetical protein CM15mP17_08290 [Gammaproteobacteria bacterium]|nr:MAG: hypothetical protein CM15mP17_08290 [Gammaproteobacteria bacterium]